MTPRRRSRSLFQTFAWPALLAVITLAALVIGLAFEGIADVFAAVGLFVPLAVGSVLAGRGAGSGHEVPATEGDFTPPQL